jgi:hypothetical protein
MYVNTHSANTWGNQSRADLVVTVDPSDFFFVWGLLRMNCTVYHYLRIVMLCWKVLQSNVAYIASYMLHRTRKDIHYRRNVFLATYEKPFGFEALLTIFIYCIWVSTRWQWSVNWYKNREGTVIYTEGETISKTIQKHRILKKQKTNTRNKKQTLKEY